MNKKILPIISVIFFAFNLISLTHFTSFAEDKSQLNDSDISKAKSAIDEYNNLFSDGKTYAAQAQNEFDLTEYYEEKGYKAYTLYPYIITDYKNNPDFKSLITDEFRLMVPGNDSLATLIPDDNGYKAIGTEFGEVTDFSEETEKIKNNINEEIINIIHTKSFTYNMDIIYVETDSNEYAVPYFDERLNGDYGGFGDRLISGTIYSVPEFMDRMDQTFDESQVLNYDGEYLFGGVPVKAYSPYVPSLTETASAEEHSNNFAITTAAIAAVAFIASLTVFLILNINKKLKQ